MTITHPGAIAATLVGLTLLVNGTAMLVYAASQDKGQILKDNPYIGKIFMLDIVLGGLLAAGGSMAGKG